MVEIASDVQVSGELSQEMSLRIPEGTQGFAIIAEGSGADLMIIGRMSGPSGELLYDFQDPFNSALQFYPGADQITQMVPTNPRSTPRAGQYRFQLIKDGAQKRVQVQAVLKTGDGEPSEGALDVNLFFARVNGLSAAQARSDSDFQSAIQTLKNIYQRRKINLGKLSYCDLSSADADRYSIIEDVEGPSSELSQMFEVSSQAGALGCNPERALNFFLVQEIVGGRAGYIILGISGGIPGPPGLHGSSHSGVAVTMTDFRHHPEQLGMTMAHEGGHYLGLFHTTEAEGTAFDPLSDTPECDNSRDRNGDGILDYGECAGVGAENLMFWAAGTEAKEVSNDQGFVLRANPALQ